MGVYLLLHLRPPTPKQTTVEAHAYNKLYGLRPDLDHGLPGVASYKGHGSLSDSTESLPLPPSLPCHARHKEVSEHNSDLRDSHEYIHRGECADYY